MIRVYLLIAVISASSLFVQYASASTLTYYTLNSTSTPRYSSLATAGAALCVFPKTYIQQVTSNTWYYWGGYQTITAPGQAGSTNCGTIRSNVLTCPLGHTGTTCNTVLPSCPYGTFDPVANTCPEPPSDPCAANVGQVTKIERIIAGGFEAYTPPGETVNSGGCTSTLEVWNCGLYPSGEYICKGVVTNTGVSAPESLAPEGICAGDCPTDNPDPLTNSTTGPTCSAPVVTGSTTAYTCVSESSASEFAPSDCAMGSYNGTTGMICTKPAYVPESLEKTRTDQVETTSNPNGSTTEKTTSTTETTHCAGGVCKNESTTTTSTKTTNPDGSVTNEETTCSGSACEKPEEPEKLRLPEPNLEFDELPSLDAETPTYKDSLNVFIEHIEGMRFVQAARNISAPQSGGSCDMPTLNLWGGSIDTHHFCNFIPTILEPLGFIFLAFYGWVALRIILSA